MAARTFIRSTFQGAAANATVELDDAVFEDCTFTGCVLVFRGGTPPVFKNCRFDQSKIQLAGSAHNTLLFLHNFVTAGEIEIAESLLGLRLA